MLHNIKPLMSIAGLEELHIPRKCGKQRETMLSLKTVMNTAFFIPYIDRLLSQFNTRYIH